MRKVSRSLGSRGKVSFCILVWDEILVVVKVVFLVKQAKFDKQKTNYNLFNKYLKDL